MPSPTKPDLTTSSKSNDENGNTGQIALYDFSKQGMGEWRIQDDVVMGGRSDSNLEITEGGNARFFGKVSLKNNGGFCSIHQTVEKEPYVMAGKSAFILLLKGDGKDYNFRVRTPKGRHAYAFTFSTTGSKWEAISIPFDAMAATYRGEPVDVPNYAGEQVVEMQLLIGNGKAEEFELLIEAIGAL